MKKLILILVVFLLVGCSSTGDTTTSTTDPATTTATTTTEKSLTVATITDLQSMDQLEATDGTSFIAIANTIVGLTSVDADGMVIPEIATSWDISEDKTVYTFYLDENAVWNNGDPVTANDFVYAWKRMCDPENAATYEFIFETVKLSNFDSQGDDFGAKAIDDYTLEVTLDAPVDFFLGLLAFPSFFPLNEEFVEAQGDQYALSVDNLLANGPYVLNEWTQGNEFSFAKNDTYAKADEVNLDTLTFKVLKDPQTAMMGFETGDIDVVPLSGDLVDLYSDRPEFTNRLQGYVWYLSLNELTDLENKNLRLAIAQAFDREAIATSVLKDGSIAAEGIIPVDLAVSPDGTDFREDSGAYLTEDVELAQEYFATALDELGVDSLELELLFEDSDSSKSVAEFLKSELETNLPGLTITLKSQTKKARLELMDEGDFEIGLTRWGPDYADPQTYLDLFTSWVGDDTNSARYASDEYDALITEAFYGESSKDSQARWELMLEAEKVLLEDAAIAPIYQNGGAVMINQNVTGIEFHSVSIDSYKHADITE